MAVALALVGCGAKEKGPRERADRPTHPPPGWRTVHNGRAGFTIAAPGSWAARTRRGATLIRSKDKLVAVTVAADRSDEGRSTAPARYAQQLIDDLPDFEGSIEPGVHRVLGTPYPTARVEGSGTLKTTRRPQLISVVVYQRPRAVTYAAVVFRTPGAESAADRRILERMLRTFRAGPPG
jgi:hypothetical protein